MVLSKTSNLLYPKMDYAISAEEIPRGGGGVPAEVKVSQLEYDDFSAC